MLDRLDLLVSSVAVAGKQIHDTNIVAMMLAHSVQELLTHNVKDFARFARFIMVVPFGSTP